MILQVPDRFSLEETVLSHGWHQLAPFYWSPESSSLRRVESLPGGSHHVLTIDQPGGNGRPLRIRHAGNLSGRAERLFIRSRVIRMLNLDLDLSGFYRLCRKEARLRYVPRMGAGRFLSAGNIYEDVFKAICGTNISWKQAVRAINRVAVLGRRAQRSDLRAFPGPEEIISAGPERLSAITRLGYRVPYLLAWARRVSSGDPAWEAAEEGSLGREELRRFFLSVRGIGKTTCDYLLMIRGVADEIPVDSSVLLYLRENRFRGRTPSPGQVRRLYERFGPWKAYVYWFEFLPWAREHWALQGKPLHEAAAEGEGKIPESKR